MRNKSIRPAILIALYACATVQFIRFYMVSTIFYLNLPSYLAGHERLPFQERILPVFLIDGLRKLPLFQDQAMHAHGAFTPGRAPVYVIALVAMVIAGVYTQMLYRRTTGRGELAYLVYPLFLFSMIWTYSLHLEANYAYPYDLLSVAFFSAGLYYIYTRNFAAVVVIMVLGTLNRETTLFLIGIFALDAVYRARHALGGRARGMQLVRRLPWLQVAVLSVIWIGIKVTLAHMFAQNSRAEDYLRIVENLGRLKVRLLPALLNICGYMLPVTLLFVHDLHPRRFRQYLYIVPVWFAIMFCTGVILETRIYGELCPYVAVALVLIIEQKLGRRGVDAPQTPTIETGLPLAA